MNTLVLSPTALGELATWDPAVVLGPDIGTLWPVPAESTLADLTSKVLAQPGFEGPYLRPVDVDSGSGALTIRRTEARGWSFVMGKHGLREGDLLVSRAHPTVFVTREFSGLQFSTLFSALRAVDGVDPLWLWACLNTSAGSAVRDASSVGGTVPRLNASAATVPDEPAHWSSIRDSIASLAAAIGANVGIQDGGQSWWRIAHLPSGESWAPLLAAPDPSVFMQGERLGDLAHTIRSGRRPTADNVANAETMLPVWGVPQLHGRQTDRYAPRESGVIASPGDVLLQRTGLKGSATVATQECLADSSLFVVTLRDPDAAPAVASFLNSAAGQRQRAFRVVGTVIPALNRDGTLELRVDLDAAVNLAPDETPSSLAHTLDALIWP